MHRWQDFEEGKLEHASISKGTPFGGFFHKENEAMLSRNMPEQGTEAQFDPNPFYCKVFQVFAQNRPTVHMLVYTHNVWCKR